MKKEKQGIWFTSMRQDKRTGEVHMRNMSLHSMLNMIVRETKREMLENFRERSSLLEGLGVKIDFSTQRISVAAHFRKEGIRGWRYAGYNGLVLLSIDHLNGPEETETAKRLARMHPSTLAAFVGASGRSVKVIVRVSYADGSLPQDEREALAFHEQAYNVAFCTYYGMVEFPITRVSPTLEQSFVRTFDPSPYVNPAAVALKIEQQINLTLNENSEDLEEPKPLDRLQPGAGSYAELEQRFLALTTRVAFLKRNLFTESGPSEVFLTELAKECQKTGFPQEEAIVHACAHFGDVVGSEKLRTIIECAYELRRLPNIVKETYNQTQFTALRFRDFMRQHYVLRHNVIQDSEEYRTNATWDTQFHALDDRMLGKIVNEARLRGIDVWDKDVRRYARSADTPSFNPVEEFLNSVRGAWDGTDRIAALASCVRTKNPHWQTWFRRWFLSMTAQWMGVMGRYGNSVAPLLIGRQGWRKSTFCRNLLPDQLEFGYTDHLNLSSKTEVDRTICQYLLVNLDEFDQLSSSRQDGYLKNLLQRADIRARQPYKTQVTTMRRYASFIGTSNQRSILTDPTGGRRYLCIELSGPIDVTSRPDYSQLYAQAVHLVENGERYWFDESDVETIMDNNRQYMNLGSAETIFHDLYTPAQPNDEGAKWMTTTALMDEIRRHAGSRLTLSPVTFGRYLMALPEMSFRRSRNGTIYCVKRVF